MVDYLHKLTIVRKKLVVMLRSNLGNIFCNLMKIQLQSDIRITPSGPTRGHICLVMLSAPTGSDIITCSALHSK